MTVIDRLTVKTYPSLRCLNLIILCLRMNICKNLRVASYIKHSELVTWNSPQSLSDFRYWSICAESCRWAALAPVSLSRNDAQASLKYTEELYVTPGRTGRHMAHGEEWPGDRSSRDTVLHRAQFSHNRGTGELVMPSQL